MGGIFEPLYGKNNKVAFEPVDPAVNVPKPAPTTSTPVNVAEVVKSLTQPFVKKNELGQLFQELDRSKVFIILLVVAIVVVFTLLLVVNSRQKKQRSTILALQKRMKRLRNH